MTQTSLANQEASFSVPPLLDVTRLADKEIVHVGATPIAQYHKTDVTMRRHVMVQLAEAGRISGVYIAERFQVTPVYVSMLRGRVRAEGSAALTAKRRGPKGPWKVTGSLEDRVRALRQAGLAYRAIAAQVRVSHVTVRRVLDALDPRQASLPVEPPPDDTDPAPSAVTPVADEQDTATTAVAPAVVARPEEPARPIPAIAATPGGTPSRYAGAMLLHVALTQLRLWHVFAERGAQIGRTALTVEQIVGMVALGFALRLGSIERFKTACARDFGLLLGLRAVPCVQTLRMHLVALAESVAPEAIMRALLAASVQLEPVWEHADYVDGHFSPYAGQEPVGKGWNAKRRLAEPGHTDVHVHDATGRALFFLNRPLNDSLVKVLPDIVQEIRAVAPEGRVLLVFDRGGYSGAAFRALTKQHIGFITYLKGRKARRRFPSDRFTRRWWQFDDPAGIRTPRRHVYRLYERGTRIRGAGVVRTLVMEDADGQIPVLTNCDQMAPAKVVHLLRLRWRQENSFKYLSTHYGIEQIIQYGATTAPDDRMVDNPVRARLRQHIAELRATLVFQAADVGQAVLDGASAKAAAPTDTRHAARKVEARLARLEHRLEQTPTKVPARSLPRRSPERATLDSD
ncbi:MAG: helix-turn-helix domain-containing protein, partial [Acidobacteria bacterium]|nr:helix-turn-helix domain-containing protein [Acidobacteriota bacterium]